MKFHLPIKMALSLCFVAFVLIAACGENEENEHGGGGNGGNPPPIPTVLCDTNCAVAGACSGHDGVACSSGPDTDGSVICADGYKDSSIKYNCY